MATYLVEAIEEEDEINLTKVMSSVTIVKSMGILLMNDMLTRRIHKKMKQKFQGKKMMMKTQS